MRNERIRRLKKYKQLLIECKKLQIIDSLNNKVECKFPNVGKNKQKILTLYK